MNPSHGKGGCLQESDTPQVMTIPPTVRAAELLQPGDSHSALLAEFLLPKYTRGGKVRPESVNKLTLVQK